MDPNLADLATYIGTAILALLVPWAGWISRRVVILGTNYEHTADSLATLCEIKTDVGQLKVRVEHLEG